MTRSELKQATASMARRRVSASSASRSIAANSASRILSPSRRDILPSLAISANLARVAAAAARASALSSLSRMSMSGRTMVRSSELHNPRAARSRAPASGSRRQARRTPVKSISRSSSASSIMRSSAVRLRSGGILRQETATDAASDRERPEKSLKSECLMGLFGSASSEIACFCIMGGHLQIPLGGGSEMNLNPIARACQ